MRNTRLLCLPPAGCSIRCRSRVKTDVIFGPRQVGALGSRLLEDWRPEDRSFWNTRGRAIAKRSLWLSIPSLFLSVAV